MESVSSRQGISQLRDEAFRLADSLAREAMRSGTTPETLDAATTLQSVAYMLGDVERCLGGPEVREVKARLSAA
jgi:hypothetical protein